MMASPTNVNGAGPRLDPLLEQLVAIGGPDDSREPVALVEAFDRALRELATPPQRERPFAELWADLERLRSRLPTDDPRVQADVLGALRDAVDRARANLGLPPPPPRAIPEAHLIAFRDAKPVKHLSTDLETLDRFTLGGLWDQRFVVIAGEPNVGKTALAMQLAGVACESGCAVVVHASDVDMRADIAARIGVARGVDRAALRRCDVTAQIETSEIMRAWHLKIIDQFADDFTIEDSAEALLEMGRQTGSKRLVLVVDSLQTALCRALLGPGAPRFDKDKIEAVTRALVSATRRGILVLATSEVPRNFYSGKTIDQPSDMAAVKGSGRVEFALWTLLVLRRLRGEEANAFHLGMPKNKGGQPEGAIRLNYQSELGMFTDEGELPYETKGKSKNDDRPKQDDQNTFDAKIEAAARKLVPVLARKLVGASNEGLSVREMRDVLVGRNAAKSRAMAIAIEEKAAVKRIVKGGRERIYAPSHAPPAQDEA